jgi:hypothetical protein
VVRMQRAMDVAGMFTSSPLSMEGQLQRMGTGSVRASLFAAVGDGPVIGRRPQGGLYAMREPRPGECHDSVYRSLGSVRTRETAGRLVVIRTPADLETARAQNKPGAILAEGGEVALHQRRCWPAAIRARTS